jgi:hypothetical protein
MAYADPYTTGQLSLPLHLWLSAREGAVEGGREGYCVVGSSSIAHRLLSTAKYALSVLAVDW